MIKWSSTRSCYGKRPLRLEREAMPLRSPRVRNVSWLSPGKCLDDRVGVHFDHPQRPLARTSRIVGSLLPVAQRPNCNLEPACECFVAQAYGELDRLARNIHERGNFQRDTSQVWIRCRSNLEP